MGAFVARASRPGQRRARWFRQHDEMASAGHVDDPATPTDVPRRSWWRRLLRWCAAGVAVVLAAVTVTAYSYDLETGGTLRPPPLDANGHLVTAGGLTTHYEQWGTSGPPVVLVHGFL